MDVIRTAVLGAGSMRSGPPVLAGLAGYFGERPLEVRLYDADAERADLAERLARTLFGVERSANLLSHTADPADALEEAEWVVFCVGRNCARRLGTSVEEAVSMLVPLVPAEARVLSLQAFPVPREGVVTGGLFPEIAPETRRALPHQILRWLAGEEYPYEILAAEADGPVRRWLDSPGSLPLQAE